MSATISLQSSSFSSLQHASPGQERENPLPACSGLSSAAVEGGNLLSDCPTKSDLPKHISLDAVHALAVQNLRYSLDELNTAKIATPEQIDAAVELENLEGLTKLFNLTVIAERKENRFDYGLRQQFLDAFQNLKVQLRKKNEEHTKLFCTEGRSGESVRIFAKILLPLEISDIDYPAKMMQFAKDLMLICSADIVPGKNFRLGEIPGERKHSIQLMELLAIDARREMQLLTCEKSKSEMAEISDQLSQIHNGRSHFESILRGPIGAGKTSFLEKQFKIDESKVVCSDTIKMKLGGPLTHHEACALNDKISGETKNLPCKLDVKTNIFQRNADAICAPSDRDKLIYDISVSLETMKQRIERRAETGGHPASEREINEGFQLSNFTRKQIIDAALKNPKMTYFLYDNNQQDFALVAKIESCQLEVVNPEIYKQLIES